MIWLLFGAPGSGKGTQSKLIQEKFGFAHLSTGDVFRKHLKENTELGIQVKTFMDNGELVPDDLVIKMVNEELDSAKTTILDGFPRTLEQGTALAKIAKENGNKISGVIHLEVPEEILIARLSGRRVCKKCGEVYHISAKPPKKEGVCDLCQGEVIQRKDDSVEVIKNRLDVYKEQTQPLMDYYKDLGLLKTIDGSQDTDKVFISVKEVLN